MSASDFFIADDAHGEPWIWVRGEGEIDDMRVVSLFGVEDLRHGLALLDLIRAAVEGEVREEWGVRWRGITFHCGSRASAFAQRDAEFTGPFRRTVITGAWEEER